METIIKTQFFLLSFIVLPLLNQAQVKDSLQRKLNLKGAVNARDLGGYSAFKGKHVRWGKLYRSGEISKLTDSDVALLRHKSISRIVDLRGEKESNNAPDHLPAGTTYVLSPAGSDSLNGTLLKKAAKLKDGDSLMRSFYSQTKYLAQKYKPLFNSLLAAKPGQSVLFHCTAGKDRTGIGAALVLSALGVSRELIYADYTATDYYRKDLNALLEHTLQNQMFISKPVAKDILAAKKEYLSAFFEAVTRQYGSMGKFLEGPLNLDSNKIARLRSMYLE